MHLLLEAALRSLVMGAIVFVVLRVMRIDQVRARRTAWLLALVGALAMPALVGAQIGPRLLPELTVPKRQSYLSLDEPYIAAAASSIFREASAQHAPLIDEPSNKSAESAAIAQPASIVLTLALSRTSYAETLLEFATRARAPFAGVAMASSSNLTPRIERLLSDKGFERSFAVKHRLPYVAAGVVITAMVAATSMVRVQAAPTTQTLSTNTAASPEAPPSPNTPVDTNTRTNTDTHTKTDTKVGVGAHRSKNAAKKADARVEQDEATDDPRQEEVMAINTDHSHIMFNSGNLLPSQRGDYIYFQHDGKPYLIQDPAIIAQAQAMLAPMKALREQQQDLGRKQRELAIKQATLGARQGALAAAQVHAMKIDTPEFKRDMAELKNVIKDMHLDELTAQIDRNALAEVQAHLAEIQAATGKLTADLAMQQADFGAHQGVLGAQQGELGEQQGKLGEQQALLGEQQRKIVEEVRRQLKPIIEQAIREGKGKALTEP
jgi:bla regulator protein blaR1